MGNNKSLPSNRETFDKNRVKNATKPQQIEKIIEVLKDYKLPEGVPDKLNIALIGQTGTGKSSYIALIHHFLKIENPIVTGSTGSEGTTRLGRTNPCGKNINIFDTRGFTEALGEEDQYAAIEAILEGKIPPNEPISWKKGENYSGSESIESNRIHAVLFIGSEKSKTSRKELRRLHDLFNVHKIRPLFLIMHTCPNQSTLDDKVVDELFLDYGNALEIGNGELFIAENQIQDPDKATTEQIFDFFQILQKLVFSAVRHQRLKPRPADWLDELSRLTFVPRRRFDWFQKILDDNNITSLHLSRQHSHYSDTLKFIRGELETMTDVNDMIMKDYILRQLEGKL